MEYGEKEKIKLLESYGIEPKKYILKRSYETIFKIIEVCFENDIEVSSILFNDASTNIANCETMLGVKFINLLKNNVFKII